MNLNNEDGLLFMLGFDKSSVNDEEVGIEFVERNGKIYLKDNNRIISVVDKNSKNYQEVLQVMESLKDDKD